MLQKYLTISENIHSLLTIYIIDEFVHQGLITHISIMLFLKNASSYKGE